ncbi:hypothetical protein BGZ46_004822 [Entomortierella lignicola]|nr:hypothetical protein BGZ46_004822 [Entomortierella lignicola]
MQKGSRSRSIKYNDIGVVGRRTGCTIKSNVKKDADGMDNIEDFWNDDDADNDTVTFKSHASHSDITRQTRGNSATRSSTKLYNQDGIEYARRLDPQHRLAGYIEHTADELPDELISYSTPIRVRADRSSRGSNGTHSTGIEGSRSREDLNRSNTISTTSPPPFKEFSPPFLDSIRHKDGFAQSFSDVELDDDEAYILAALSTTRTTATSSTNKYSDRGVPSSDRRPLSSIDMVNMTPRSSRVNISSNSGVSKLTPNQPGSSASYQKPSTQSFTGHLISGSTRAISPGRFKTFDFESGIDYRFTNVNQSDSDDQSSIPPPPETPSSASHGIAISRTPEYMKGNALVAVRDSSYRRSATRFGMIDHGDQADELVPYEVEEPQDISPTEDNFEIRDIKERLTGNSKVYALEASQDESALEDGQATQSLKQPVKSTRPINTKPKIVIEVPERQYREKLLPSPVPVVTRTPKPHQQRHTFSAVQKDETIADHRQAYPQPTEESDGELITVQKVLPSNGSVFDRSRSNRKVPSRSQPNGKNLKSAQKEEKDEVLEQRKKSSREPDTTTLVKQQKVSDVDLYVVEPIESKSRPLETDESNVRRSRRAKFKPLEYWKNEKVVLGRSDNTPVPLPVVKAVIRAVPPELSRPLTKRKLITGERLSQKTKPKTTQTIHRKRQRVDISSDKNSGDDENGQGQNDSYHSEQEQSSIGHESHGECETLDDNGNVVIRAVVEEAESVNFQDSSSGKYKYHRGLEDELISSGIVRIPSGGVKPNQNAFASSVAFYVIEGTIKTTIYKNTIVLRRGGRFLVPRGNQYMIENLSKKDCLLFFAQSKTAAIDRNANNEAKAGSSLESLPVPEPIKRTPTPTSEPEFDDTFEQGRSLRPRNAIQYGFKNSPKKPLINTASRR